jgi:hypothetical protein
MQFIKKHERKSLLFILTVIVLWSYSLFFGIVPPLLNINATWVESHVDSWLTAGSYFYRNTSDVSTTLPSITLNYSNYTSAYDSIDKTTTFTSLLATISKIEVGLVTSVGSYASSGTYLNRIDIEFGAYNSTTNQINLRVNSINSGGSLTNYFSGFIVLPDDFKIFPQILVTFDFNNGTLDFRWGSYNASVYGGFTSWNQNDLATSTYNTGFKFYSGYTSNGSTPTYSAKSTSVVSSSAVIYTLEQYQSIADSYFDGLADWSFDVGYESGYSDGKIWGENHPISSALFDGFATIVGILSNFVMVFLTLQIFDVSILSIFGVVIAIAGVVFILKLVRG